MHVDYLTGTNTIISLQHQQKHNIISTIRTKIDFIHRLTDNSSGATNPYHTITYHNIHTAKAQRISKDECDCSRCDFFREEWYPPGNDVRNGQSRQLCVGVQRCGRDGSVHGLLLRTLEGCDLADRRTGGEISGRRIRPVRPALCFVGDGKIHIRYGASMARVRSERCAGGSRWISLGGC